MIEAIVFVLMLLASVVTNQGGGERACDAGVTVLPANVATQVASDNAMLDTGNPWNYTVDGFVQLTAPRRANASNTNVTLTITSNGGDDFATTVTLASGQSLRIPFTLSDPLFPSGAWNAFWVRVTPSQSVKCDAVSYITTEHD